MTSTDTLTDAQAASKAGHQTRRALKLVEVMMRHGATVEQAEIFDQTARDVVGGIAGINLPVSPTTWAIACVLLEEERARLPRARLPRSEVNPRCRFAADQAYPHHVCARRDGRALVTGEECWAEMRAQLLEEMSPAEFVDAIDDRTRCSFCDDPAVCSGVTPDGRDDIRACVDPIHQRHLRDPFEIAVGGAS